jgi:hypothetical protein
MPSGLLLVACSRLIVVTTCDGDLDEPSVDEFACSRGDDCGVAGMIRSLTATADYTDDIARHIRNTVAQQVRDAHRNRAEAPARG